MMMEICTRSDEISSVLYSEKHCPAAMRYFNIRKGEIGFTRVWCILSADHS
jgi:hypothetical protein